MCSMIPGDSARAGGLGRSEPDASASGLEGETGRENSIMKHNGVRTSETSLRGEGSDPDVSRSGEQKAAHSPGASTTKPGREQV